MLQLLIQVSLTVAMHTSRKKLDATKLQKLQNAHIISRSLVSFIFSSQFYIPFRPIGLTFCSLEGVKSILISFFSTYLGNIYSYCRRNRSLMMSLMYYIHHQSQAVTVTLTEKNDEHWFQWQELESGKKWYKCFLERQVMRLMMQCTLDVRWPLLATSLDKLPPQVRILIFFILPVLCTLCIHLLTLFKVHPRHFRFSFMSPLTPGWRGTMY